MKEVKEVLLAKNILLLNGLKTAAWSGIQKEIYESGAKTLRIPSGNISYLIKILIVIQDSNVSTFEYFPRS